MTIGSSNGATQDRAARLHDVAGDRRASSVLRSYSTTSAPSAAVRSRLSFGASDGITITAGMLQSLAAARANALGVIAR